MSRQIKDWITDHWLWPGVVLLAMAVGGILFRYAQPVTPPLCVNYCDAAIQWSEQCRAVPYPKVSCLDKFKAGGFDLSNRRPSAAEREAQCWGLIVRMRDPATKEWDCSKVPEGL